MVDRDRRVLRYAITFPERVIRAAFAGLGGATYEAAQLLLPRFVRHSRLYEATAKNALRIAVEFVGDVHAAPSGESEEMSSSRVTAKKAAGNFVELSSIAAFGFSPLWLLAGAADVLNGSRVYLRTLEAELIAAGVLAPDARFDTVDQLIGSLQGGAGTTARLIDVPPLELAELKRSLSELRADAASLPSHTEMAALLEGLRRTANAEGRSLLEVSSGVGLAFIASARSVGRTHLTVPYREDWQPLRDEGFAAYAARVSRPYREAVALHFDPSKRTFTERVPGFVRRARDRVSRRRGLRAKRVD